MPGPRPVVGLQVLVDRHERLQLCWQKPRVRSPTNLPFRSSGDLMEAFRFVRTHQDPADAIGMGCVETRKMARATPC